MCVCVYIYIHIYISDLDFYQIYTCAVCFDYITNEILYEISLFLLSASDSEVASRRSTDTKSC